MAGLGKTVLAAEAIHLWHPRFDYVLAVQAKPHPLQIDEFYRGLDKKLCLESLAYRETCEKKPYDRIHLEPSRQLTGDDRYERMRNNLINALRSEAILLVKECALDPPGAFADRRGLDLCAQPPETEPAAPQR